MTPDLARSLGHRIRNLAADRGVDPARLRRHLTFQRLLARLVDSGQWVLKGGARTRAAAAHEAVESGVTGKVLVDIG